MRREREKGRRGEEGGKKKKREGRGRRREVRKYKQKEEAGILSSYPYPSVK